ncbi:MAG TPA: helix-hairpin-helix domain-containing protein [Gemmatimonadales bacterium]|jgi:DNA polymerase (family 10)
MDREQVAQALSEIAALLELTGESPYRVRAYQAAARSIADYPGDLRHARASGALARLKGIGPATIEIVADLLDSGHSQVLEVLRDQVPPGLADLLKIGGLGVARVRTIHESLHVDSLEELESAARDGRLARLPRFGPRTAERVLRGIAFLRQQAGMLLVHHARRDVEAVGGALADVAGVDHVAVAGSMRRRCELVGDLDFVLVTTAPTDLVLDAVRRLPGVAEAVRAAPDALRLRLESGAAADAYLTPPERFGLALVHATGSAAHLEQLAARAERRGLHWSRTDLAGAEAPAQLAHESDIYRALGLPWIPPELREGMGELEAADAGRLPTLVEPGDLRGFLHCHSDYSDGASTVAEWAAAARAAGYGYLGITDHSPATAFGGGLHPDDIGRQHAEIDAENASGTGLRLLKGVEADILADGSLDYTADLRRRFDFIIASVHSRHGMSADEMTARMLKAMDDPTMTILGHPTGRLLLSRDPYPLDLDAVFSGAAARGVAIEINADPQRLDLDWRILRRARDAGVTISIGADAHGAAQLHHMEFGIGIARKGWLGADAVINTRSLEEFLAFAARGTP